MKAKLINKLKLKDLDTHESLRFVEESLNVKPSQIALIAILVSGIILMAIDGTGFITGILCFLLPALRCLQRMCSRSKTRKLEREQMTDEQFSRFLEEADENFQHKYIIYFMMYLSLQLVSPIGVFLISSLGWMVLRILFTFLALHPKLKATQKVKAVLKRKTD